METQKEETVLKSIFFELNQVDINVLENSYIKMSAYQLMYFNSDNDYQLIFESKEESLLYKVIIRFDGCSHFYFNNYYHICGIDDLANFNRLNKHVFKIAYEEMFKLSLGNSLEINNFIIGENDE